MTRTTQLRELYIDNGIIPYDAGDGRRRTTTCTYEEIAICNYEIPEGSVNADTRVNANGSKPTINSGKEYGDRYRYVS